MTDIFKDTQHVRALTKYPGMLDAHANAVSAASWLTGPTLAHQKGMRDNALSATNENVRGARRGVCAALDGTTGSIALKASAAIARSGSGPTAYRGLADRFGQGGMDAKFRRDLLFGAGLPDSKVAMDSLRLFTAPPGFAAKVRDSMVLDARQHEQLRTALSGLSARQATAMTNIGKVTDVQRALADVRSSFAGDRVARQVLLALGRDGHDVLRASKAHQWTLGSARSTVYGAQLGLAVRAANLSLQQDARTRDWLRGMGVGVGLRSEQAEWMRRLSGQAGALGVNAYMRSVELPNIKGLGGLGLNLSDFGTGRLFRDTTGFGGVLAALDFAVADDALFEAVGDELLPAEDESIAAVMALVMWSQAASSDILERGRAVATGGRLVVARSGAVARELGLTIVEEVWSSAPLWPARALREVAPELTADERLALTRLRRDIVVAFISATATGVVLSPVLGMGSVVFWWLGMWPKLKALYEEIARACHVHGRDDIIPHEWRHE